jgi:tetratricopeptide (TPR) repeat protein
MAALYAGRQMLSAALPHLETAVRLEPNSAEVHGWLGQTYLALGRLPEAQRELETMLSLSPNDIRAEVMLGVTFLRMGRPEAESRFRDAIRINPREPRAWYWLGILLRMQERQPEWNQVLQTGPRTLAFSRRECIANPKRGIVYRAPFFPHQKSVINLIENTKVVEDLYDMLFLMFL